MEDSFRVRLDKAFGSLPLSSTSPSSLSSLWSLADDEINATRSTRPNPSEPKPDPKPYAWSTAETSSTSFSSTFRAQLENDLDDLNDEDDDDGDDDAGFRRTQLKPDDYDDEQWQIRSGIGLDCTLDYEEEEDKYDKQAIGKENQGDRVYMKDIADDGVKIDYGNAFPSRFGEHVRDPRANHLAAKIRLKQDDEAAKNIDGLHVSDKSAPEADTRGGKCGGDSMNLKPILKSKDKPPEQKSQKRVRFDPECDVRGDEDDEYEGTRDVRMKTCSAEEAAALEQPSKAQQFASAVPDYIRNPSRYTRYTFDDSSDDIDDKSNKAAYMSFLSQLKGSKAAGSEEEDAMDDLPSVTFISRKKSGDATMAEHENVPKHKGDVGKENRRAFTVSIAAGETENSDICAMEEDMPEEAIKDVKKSSQRLNRKYRKKTQDELDEPAV
ncbi:hypothetical protein PIB30_095435 [Stylosanthes scabra]|uniref:U5 small nuclear ribonucleoprotein TSSC4 n=1 Tax=Stylosanthes scabra TaxID=79078 RepID=A0ABU6SW38_9FABA|nr:hypothetical protein [Stylosanthes scabra]